MAVRERTYPVWFLGTLAPDEWRNKTIFIEFEGVYMNAEISLNGNVIKRQNYGYTTFWADLNEYIKYDAENNLAVVVDNASVPNSRWYSGSGIYRYFFRRGSGKPDRGRLLQSKIRRDVCGKYPQGI
jgi:beta-galactosidase/beta-glucuronidase